MLTSSSTLLQLEPAAGHNTAVLFGFVWSLSVELDDDDEAGDGMVGVHIRMNFLSTFSNPHLLMTAAFYVQLDGVYHSVHSFMRSFHLTKS